MDVGDVRGVVDVAVPRVLGDHRPSEHLVGITYQALEETALLGRERYGLALTRHSQCCRTELEIADPKLTSQYLGLAACQCSQPGQELREREGP